MLYQADSAKGRRSLSKVYWNRVCVCGKIMARNNLTNKKLFLECSNYKTILFWCAMNKIQQEIKFFHDKLKPILEKVLEQYHKKNTSNTYHTITKPCKKLIQKCSYKSILDTSCLCSLAYWLYIYGDKELALEICEITHEVEFSFDFSGWNCGIQNIYGLEIRIARELLGENRRNYIPSNLLEYCFSKKVKKELRYPQILREDKIADCSSCFVNTELLLALYHMIGLGETGLHTELNKHWEKIEETIKIYIDYLRED